MPEALSPSLLLVDDDRHIRLFLKARLAFLGAQITVAQDGEEAMEILSRQRPDIIVSDAVMPRMDGFDFCRRCKQDPLLGTIPFMLLTSLTQNLRERAQQAGVDDYLSKSENDLVFRIRMRLMLEIGLRGKPRLPEELPPDSATVLLVSKSSAIQALLPIHLSKHGIKVVGVSSTGAVLNHLREQGADALLIDTDQGPEALDFLLGNLSNEPLFSALPIMALAGKAEEAQLAMLEPHIQDRLLKPLDGPETRHRVKLLLRLA